MQQLPDKCVYGLFNDQGKKVYIGYSNNTPKTLCNNLLDLKYSNKDFNLLEFKIIEAIEDSNRLKVRYEYWVSHYSNEGWEMYRNFKAVQYKLRIEVKNDELVKGGGNVLIYVKLVSRGYREVVVGVFDDLDECNKFVADNYSNIIDVIFCSNELTIKYRKFL